MLDLIDVTNQYDYVKVFYNNGSGGTNATEPSDGSWQTWTKPRNKCNFIWMMCIGGGNGGQGGGYTTLGQGGGSAPITVAIFPANLLPDTLYVWPGKGGAGGIGVLSGAQNAGLLGGLSLVAIRPVPTSIYTYPGSSELVCSSGISPAGIAFNGQLPGNSPTSYLPKLMTLGIWSSVAGKGRASGDVTPLKISSDTSPVNSITCPGADGGDINTTSGNSILSINLGSNIVTPKINGGAILAPSPGQGAFGENGIWNWKPMFGTGGAGGATADQLAGRGGDGAYGCGGGGGAAYLASTGGIKGGDGGNGGDGLVIIATF